MLMGERPPSKNNISVVFGMVVFHLIHRPFSFKIKKSLIKHYTLSRTDNTIRGTTLFYGKIPYSLQDTNISLATDVCVTSWNTQRITLLTMPSAAHLTVCISIRFSAPRTLCSAHILLLLLLQRFIEYLALIIRHYRATNVK